MVNCASAWSVHLVSIWMLHKRQNYKKKQNLMLKMRFTSSGVGEHQIGMPQGDTRQRVERLLGELNVMS